MNAKPNDAIALPLRDRLAPEGPAGEPCRSILDRTVQVLQYTEFLISNRSRIRWKKAEVIVDSLWHGPSFVMTGLAEKLQLLKIWFVLTIVWWAAMVGMAFVTSGSLGGWAQAGWGAAVMATACLIFRIPSVSTLHGVRRSSVILLASTIREICPDDASLSALKDNLSSLSEVSDKQALRIQTVLGLYWAALVWFVVTWVLAGSVSQTVRNASAGWALLASLVFVFAGIGSMGYGTASRLFWQTVDLALAEAAAGTVEVGKPLPDGVERSNAS